MGVPKQNAAIGRRKYSRLRVRLPAKLVTLSTTISTVLLDISIEGAKIEAKGDIHCGDQAVLLWDRYEAFGRIAWIDGPACGVLFEEPITPKVLIATRDLDDEQHLPEDRELDRRRVQAWVNGAIRC